MEKPAAPHSANRSGKSTPTRRKDDEQDDEEQKLRLEREEKERVEEAKRKLEEERINALQAIREVEENETQVELDHLKDMVLQLQDNVAFDAEWERYMRCDGKPDPSSLTQINTFISLTKQKKNADINAVLDDAQLILALISELNYIIKSSETSTEKVAVHRSTVIALQELLLTRYNDATLKLLKEATYSADSETGNLQKVIKGESETVMLWGNLNKNPRFKSYEFEEEKFQFELPKVLAVADIAIRILKTKFDHYSHQCSTFYPKVNKPIEVVAEKVAEDEAKLTADKDDKSSVKNEDEDTSETTATPDGRKSEMSNKSGKDADEKEAESEEKTAEEAPALEEEAEEKKNVEIELDEILDPDVVDLRQFHPLGGVYHIDLVEMPPQPKAVKGWTLTQIIDKPLSNVKYPSDQPAKTASRSSSAVPEARDEGATQAKTPVEQLQPPIGVTMKLPADVMFLEEPQVAVWDKNDLHWKTKGISEAVFDEEKRVLSFKTSEFGVFSLLQDAHLNMPFQSWELRPKTVDSILLTVTGAIAEAEIEIKGKKCRLNPPSEDPPSELAHIHGRWMSVEDLVEETQKSGVNVFPAEDSHKFVSVHNKVIDFDRVYYEMAVLSSAFAFSWSKWNSDAPENSIVFQAAPFLLSGKSTDPDSVPDDYWSSFFASNDRCYMMAISEFDDVFDASISSGCEYHCNLLHAIRHSSKQEDADKSIVEASAKKSKTADAFLVNTVYHLLKATKFISFS